MHKAKNIVVAGIPATTRLVVAIPSDRPKDDQAGKRRVPLTMPRVLWLERPEIYKELAK